MPFLMASWCEPENDGEHQVADVRMARMDGQARGLLHFARDGIDVREIEPGMNALRVEIERERHQVHVARAFAIAEQATFDAIARRPAGRARRPRRRCRDRCGCAARRTTCSRRSSRVDIHSIWSA